MAPKISKEEKEQQDSDKEKVQEKTQVGVGNRSARHPSGSKEDDSGTEDPVISSSVAFLSCFSTVPESAEDYFF